MPATPQQRVLLVVDVSYQCYRAAAAHPQLKDINDNFTGGIYGFFMTLAKAVRETKATDLILCLDVKPYVRSRIYPEYKMIRKKAADPELTARAALTKKQVQQAMAELGWESWGVQGFESDDLIGFIVRRDRHRYDAIYAMANDSDLYQLMDIPNFHLYAKDILDIWNGRRLADDLGLTPHQYMLATALTGTHNDIAGIRGVGPVTAYKAVKDPALLRGYTHMHGAMIERNLALIKLPHAELPRRLDVPKRWRAHGSDRRTLYRVLGDYDIDTTAAMVDSFEQLWEGYR